MANLNTNLLQAKGLSPNDQGIHCDWWEIFGDPQLNALEEQVTPFNQDLKIAGARLRESRAMIRFNRSALFLTISTSPSVANERVSANEPYFPSSEANNGTGNYTLPFDLSYEVDLWGGCAGPTTRRARRPRPPRKISRLQA